MKALHILGIVSIVLSLAGCTCGNDTAATVDGGAAIDPELLGVAPEVASRVIARVDEVELTVLDFGYELDAIGGNTRARFLLPAQREALLDQMIEERALGLEASRRGFDQSSEARRARDAVLATASARAIVESAPIEPSIEDIRGYYDQHLSDYHVPENARIKIMHLATEASARDVLARVRAAQNPGEHWDEVARTESIQTPPFNGSQELEVHRTRLDGDVDVAPEIRQIAFEGMVGDAYPEPVLLGDQYYLVWVLLRAPASDRSFEDARDGIRELLRHRFETRLLDEVVRPVLEQMRVDEDALSDVRVPAL